MDQLLTGHRPFHTRCVTREQWAMNLRRLHAQFVALICRASAFDRHQQGQLQIKHSVLLKKTIDRVEISRSGKTRRCAAHRDLLPKFGR